MVFQAKAPGNFWLEANHRTTGLFTFNTLKFDVVDWPTYEGTEINTVYIAKRFTSNCFLGKMVFIFLVKLLLDRGFYFIRVMMK